MAAPRFLMLALCLYAAAARPGRRATAQPRRRRRRAEAPEAPAALTPAASAPVVDPRSLAVLKRNLEERVDMYTPAGEHGVVVRFDLAMNKLLQFDQVQGVAQWSVFYRLFWNDERLSFNGTEEFGEGWQPLHDFISMPTEVFWTPDAVPFYSSAVSFENYGCSVYDDAFLEANGYNVMWSRPGVIDVPCEMNLDLFPFDTQRCDLVVGPWTDRSYRFKALREGNSSSRFSGDLNSEEWEVVSAFMESKAQEYINGIFEEVHYTLVFRRFPHYYVVNAVLPMALIVVLSLLTMWLPIEGGSGERLGFSVTLLLTIMATALFTAEFRPATREDTWLDRYQACCLILTFIPVFESVIVVWLQFVYEKVSNDDSDDPKEPKSPQHIDALTSEERGKLRRWKTTKSLVNFSSLVQSRRVISAAKTSMQANFRMRLIVFLVQKLPSFEWLITGRKGRDPVSPRTLDIWARHGTAILALVVTGQMVRQVPHDQEGGSIGMLLVPIYTGGIFYLLSASLAVLFLLFRVSVLCSEASVAKARVMMHLAHHEERREPAGEEYAVGLPPDAFDPEAGVVLDPSSAPREEQKSTPDFDGAGLSGRGPRRGIAAEK